MTIEDKARKLVKYLHSLPDFRLERNLDYGDYDHIGAVIVAAVLQAGLTWNTTVQPKVKEIIRKYPSANTTSGFLAVLDTVGAKKIIGWRDSGNSEKPNRIVAVTQLFIKEGIETEAQLRDWLMKEGSTAKLMALRGIKKKTADFFKMLVGIETSAMDRYFHRLFLGAGIETSGYDEMRDVVNTAADLLKIERRIFDFSVWTYMRNKEQTAPRLKPGARPSRRPRVSQCPETSGTSRNQITQQPITLADAIDLAGKRLQKLSGESSIPRSNLIREVLSHGNWPEHSVTLADYCYNRTNKGARRDELRVFFYVSRGKYKYVGRNYSYLGSVAGHPRGGQKRARN